MRRAVAVFVLVLATLPLTIASALAQGSAPAASLQDLSWLAGHWVGTTASGQHIEEMWMPARDGLMIGSFRWELGQGRWLFEFMSLDTGTAAAPAPLTFRLKHFDRGFRGREDKAVSTTLLPKEVSTSRVLFEMKEGDRIVRLTYTYSAPDRLLVVFDETAPGETAAHIEFPFRRERP
jgi:hypothetical protein